MYFFDVFVYEINAFNTWGQQSIINSLKMLFMCTYSARNELNVNHYNILKLFRLTISAIKY